jgi:putative ATP-dependent endonuclease of OLD family
MYVSRIVVRNFRNFRKLDVALKPGVTCIVGENNAGKTNLLRALRLPIDITLTSQYRFLLASDFSAGLDPTAPQQILVGLELREYAGKENEEAMVASWAISDNVARVTYRFRPKPAIVEAIDAEERPASGLTLEDYRWEIVGGGDIDPATVEWNQQFGQKIRFDELQLSL